MKNFQESPIILLEFLSAYKMMKNALQEFSDIVAHHQIQTKVVGDADYGFISKTGIDSDFMELFDEKIEAIQEVIEIKEEFLPKAIKRMPVRENPDGERLGIAGVFKPAGGTGKKSIGFTPVGKYLGEDKYRFGDANYYLLGELGDNLYQE